MKYVLLFIAITGLGFAQAKFVDNSPAGSPLSLAGSKDEKTGECNIAVHDNDQRPVAAVVIHFDARTHVDQIMGHDYFFRSDEQAAMYGKDFDMHIDCNKPTVAMTVQLVQFNDGQVWGGSDAKTVRALAAERREAMDYLHEVLSAPDMTEALAKTEKGTRNSEGKFITGRLNEQSLLKVVGDPVATARDRLANAEAHSSWLLNLK